MISKEKFEKASKNLLSHVLMKDLNKSFEDVLSKNNLSMKDLLSLIGLKENYQDEDITLLNICKLALLSKHTWHIDPSGYDISEDPRKKLLNDFFLKQQEVYEKFIKDNELEDVAPLWRYTDFNDKNESNVNKKSESTKDDKKNQLKRNSIGISYSNDNGKENYSMSINGKKYKPNSWGEIEEIFKTLDEHKFI